MKQSELRRIPPVDKVLSVLGDMGLPHPVLLAIARRELARLRKSGNVPSSEVVIARVRQAAARLCASRIRPLINGTGVLIHTNFGRAPLGPAVIENLAQIASHYNNLEYDVAGGVRGSRATYLEHNLALLCGSEAAAVVNNNAAALVLILRYLCWPAPGKSQRSSPKAPRTSRPRDEVIISRGELVQIGGGFRIPEILEASGGRLREVGTTNKTSLDDYARAISPETALLLKVHRSNFFMSGFVESPSAKEIAALARKKGLPFVEDLGSGAMVETRRTPGLEHEPTPVEVMRSGADLVCFSGDKLFGGPQAGIIAGKAKLIAGLKREPFFRALRSDKLALSALETIVDGYLREQSSVSSAQASFLCSEIPVLSMLSIANDELLSRAHAILGALEGLSIKAIAGTGRSQVGGGTLPRSAIESITLDLRHASLKPQELAARLREGPVPVIGYIERDKFKVDLRTVFPHQDAELVRAIQSAGLENEAR